MRALNKISRQAMRLAPFHYAIGSKGSRVVITERADRSGRLEMRYTDPMRTGRDRRVKRKLDVNLRGADGRIRSEIERRVISMARSQEQRLRTARATAGTFFGVDAITIGGGVELALGANGSGVYLGAARQAADAERYLRRLTCEYLDPDSLLDQLLPQQIEAAMTRWLKDAAGTPRLADRSVHGDPGVGGTRGFRSLEVAMSAFEKTVRWLQQNRHLSPNVLVVPSDWRRILSRLWERLAGGPYCPSVPRHTRTEVGALFDALDRDADIDPRIQLAFSLGAELRIGQLLYLNRSNVDLEADEHNPFGRLHVPARGSKPGATIGLDASQHSELCRALASGYLQEFEHAYRSGCLRDFPIFVGGKLAKGVARLRRTPVRWGRRAALSAFHELEAAAGVTSVSGRGWYGVRRAFADAAPMAVTDQLVLEQMGAHSTATQNRHYRDRAYPELVARAREARNAVRTRLREHAPPKEPPT